MNAHRDGMLLLLPLRCSVRLGTLRVVVAVFSVVLCCPKRSCCQTRPPVKKVEDPVFSGLVGPSEPGFAALVRVNGKTSYQLAEGVTDLRTQRKIDGRTRF